MAGCKDHFAGCVYCRTNLNVKLAVTALYDIGNARVEVVLSAMLYDALTDVFHDDRELVTADMRMGIYENRWVCTEEYKLMEHFADISPL